MDPEYHKSLMYILDHDVEEVCPDTAFVTEVDFFGRKDIVELKPGGASIMVLFYAPTTLYLCTLVLCCISAKCWFSVSELPFFGAVTLTSWSNIE